MCHSKRTVFFALAVLGMGAAQGLGQTSWWSFDEMEQGQVRDKIGGAAGTVSGGIKAVAGVQGGALKFDGFTARIVCAAEEAPRLGERFTLEAWVALGAYPWNWAPILAQENTISLNSNLDAVCWPADITVNSPRQGFFFGVGPGGHLGLHMGGGSEWIVCRSADPLPLRAWSHVAAVFEEGRGILLYVNGRPAGKAEFSERYRPAEESELRLGMSHQKLEPSHPVRAFATLASWYSLDGILDEVKIHAVALDAARLTAAAALKPASEPDLPQRVMPSGPPGQGVFGASYMKLEYDDGWDALWPVGSDPDIVVQFDQTPVRVVFWRGTRYGPAWVMENGLWMGDQSIENFSNDDGCIEHMLDPRCRFSRVRIIENSSARVVVHWRYCPTSANGNHSQVDSRSGWEDWVDEYYTFYPDALGVRKVIQHSRGRSLWPEEVIALCHPGQRPEDIIELSAMTLLNLKGKSHTYTWAESTPKVRDGDRYLHFGSAPDERPVIMMVNLKSRVRPFQIFETDCRFTIFAHEMRKGISHFPWWNHWPVAQIPSDGRYCQAADRASHFSLAWGGPQPHVGTDEESYWWAWLYGATDRPPDELVPLAKSWLSPPAMEIRAGSAASEGYDLTQRCYIISRNANDGGPIEILWKAGPESPIHNLALVIKDWGDADAGISLGGRFLKEGPDVRFGRIRRINAYDLVVWMSMQAERPVSLTINRMGSR